MGCGSSSNVPPENEPKRETAEAGKAGEASGDASADGRQSKHRSSGGSREKAKGKAKGNGNGKSRDKSRDQSGDGSASGTSSDEGGRSSDKGKKRSRKRVGKDAASPDKGKQEVSDSCSSDGEKSGSGRKSGKGGRRKRGSGRKGPPGARPALPSGKLMPALPGGGKVGSKRRGSGGKGGVDIKQITKAIMNDNLTAVQKLLNSPAAKVDDLYSCSSVPNSTLAFEGATLLHLAVFLGKFNIAKFVLIKNADLNVRCDRISDSKSRFHSVTAFHMVVALCSLEMIDLFLRSGAILNEMCDEYVTYKYFYYANVSVLHLACFRKDANAVVDLLLTKASEYDGILELLAGEIRPHNEKHSTDKSIVNLSQSNAKNIFRDVTCLHIAVALNRKALVKAFMKNGARTDAVCGEVSFKYELNRRNKELANANRPSDQKEITHGLHSYKDKTVTQLAFLTERTTLMPILKDWKSNR